jgi:hypothetical protein
LDVGEARWKAQRFRRASVLHVPIFRRNSSLRPEWFVAIGPFLAHHLQWAVHEGVQHFLMHPSQGWDIGSVRGTRHHLLVRKYTRCYGRRLCRRDRSLCDWNTMLRAKHNDVCTRS